MNRQKLRTFFHYHWQYYVLIVALVSFAYYEIFKMSKLPGYDETIFIFIESKSIQEEKLEQRLLKNLKDSSIVKVSIDHADRNDSYYSMIFQTRGLVNTDLLLISDDYLNQGTYGDYFVPLDSSLLADYFDYSSYSYFVDRDQKTYGILMNDFQQDVIEYEENKDYYLFMNKKSGKIGKFSSDSADDSALIVIGNFLKE